MKCKKYRKIQKPLKQNYDALLLQSLAGDTVDEISFLFDLSYLSLHCLLSRPFTFTLLKLMFHADH